ncbi:hypothetical protein CXF74_20130 [Psychromonas sp. Urea-02u-13]|nr:hypothetical protein CXF74_20130 [Psychromonas sp. Urea-02u-13]
MLTIKEAIFNADSTFEFNELFSLRYKVFHSCLSWGLEIDTVYQKKRDLYNIMRTIYLYILWFFRMLCIL